MRTRNGTVSCLAAMLVFAMGLGTALAQREYLWNAGTGSWNNAANWTDNGPAWGGGGWDDTYQISNGGTAQKNEGSFYDDLQIIAGHPSGAGHIEMSDGELKANYVQIGYAHNGTTP